MPRREGCSRRSSRGLPRELWLGCLEGEFIPDFSSEANAGLSVLWDAPLNIEGLSGVRPRELGEAASASRGACAPQAFARESRPNCGRARAGASSLAPSSRHPRCFVLESFRWLRRSLSHARLPVWTGPPHGVEPYL